MFGTKNDYGDMVLMSVESFERQKFENEIYLKLKEAELEARYTGKRYSHAEFFSDLRARLKGKINEDHV